VRPLRERESLFKPGQGLREVPLAQRLKAYGPIDLLYASLTFL